MPSSLKSLHPWASTPIIINAPMAGFAGSAIATAVTDAGGIGFIGSMDDMGALSSKLEEACTALLGTKTSAADQTVPIGVGFLIFVAKLEEALPVIEKFKPAAIWLFAASALEDYATWALRTRSVSKSTKIWIQIGSVEGALKLARLCAPDVLVMQGSDAGGHGWEKGAGVISLLPETHDVLASNGFAHIPLVAAGGIADGRGVAAALALGAAGVVMGTRFLSAPETTLPHTGYREAVLAAHDGGQNTVRTKVFDELRGPNIWPTLFNGRGIVTDSYTDHLGGKGIEELRRLYAEAAKGEGAGFGPQNKRTIVWAGTGVGLVNEVKTAKQIVVEVREGARVAMKRVKERL